MRLVDVTLRECEQMPGRTYTVEQKVEAGRALDRLGVPVIQAGFPVTGERDTETVRTLAHELDADVSGLARAIPSDIDAALAADADTISIFAPISDGQLEHVMHKTREEVLGLLDAAIDHARDHGAPVRVGLMDGFRTSPEHVIDAFERYPDIPTIGLADTVGMRTPAYVESFLTELDDAGVDLGRVGVHFHEDIGVATANTLVAADRGVGSADVSVAALGERAGNTPLEEVVVASVLGRNDDLGLNTTRLIPACRAVLDALDEPISPRKPILGDEVVTHESGIHTAAMLDEPSVFEPFDPADFGGKRELVFGEETGRGAARRLLERVGREPTDARVARLVDRFHADGPMGIDAALRLAETV